MQNLAFGGAPTLSLKAVPRFGGVSRKRKTPSQDRFCALQARIRRPPIATMTDHPLSSVGKIEWLPTPVTVSGAVQRGFGRGSRDLGTPTANLPGNLVDGVTAVDRDGVYLGFGCVPKFSGKPVKMVANFGRNVTYGDVKERVLEAYLMTDEYDEEFYGEEMRLCVIGFLRPEFKFNSLDDLIKHIRNDVAVTDTALDLPQAAAFRTHPSLI